MKALVITLPRESWPIGMTNHFHIIDSYVSNHVIGAVRANYPAARVETLSWSGDAPDCPDCGESFARRKQGGRNGQG